MKYFNLEGRIDDGILNKFVEFSNQYESEEWKIVLNSAGGKDNICSVILAAINERKPKTTLISCGVYSGSFIIFYFAKCHKQITNSSVGMIHLQSTEMRMMSNGLPSYIEDELTVKNWKQHKAVNDFVKEFMTKKELKKYHKGIDVYFTFKRMKEIFPDAEII